MNFRKSFVMSPLHHSVRIALRFTGIVTLGIVTLGIVTTGSAAHGQSGELFAEPFVVEHYLVQVDETGEP